MPTQHLLIDVRSPAEFASGALTSAIAPTVNIEYQAINQLPNVYAARGINVSKDARITLYCRSGRRSSIALQTLRSMGYRHVRDIGGLEDARRVLDVEKEEVRRQVDSGVGDEEGEGQGGKGEEMRTRVKSFGALVEGLKALEG